MGVFFANAPGTVVRIDPVGVPLPFQLLMEGWGGYFSQNAIITQGGISLEGSFQFLHTLLDFIYVYTFGDRIAEMTVSGVAFLSSCIGGVSGVELALAYYNANRIAGRGTPVKLGFGLSGLGSFEGFLTGMRTDVVDAQSMLGQFAYRFNVFPAGSGS